AGGAGDEDEATVLLGEAPDAGRQAQLLEVRDVLGNDAERERDVPALAEGVDAEARQILFLVGDVEIAAGLERLEALGRAFADDLEHGLGIAVAELGRLLERAE